jgi:prepilin-type N-terminal cleavage/methylation domain-containing protein
MRVRINNYKAPFWLLGPASSKIQDPNSRETASDNQRSSNGSDLGNSFNGRAEFRRLRFGASLELGAWNLELRHRRAFTLMELILVMTVLTIAASITAPALANFFRGRSLDSEARRLLSLIRQGQSRAVSEGLPMDLWIDAQQGAYGLEAEPSYEVTDSKAVSFTLEKEMQLQVGNLNLNSTTGFSSSNTQIQNSTRKSSHPNLPSIRFLPDGSIAETSPQTLQLTGSEGRSIWVALSRNGLSYELRPQKDQ